MLGVTFKLGGHYMDWANIGIIATAVLTISTIILNSLGILEKFGSVIATMFQSFTKLFKRTSNLPENIPSKTIAIVQQPRINALWWSEGSMADRPLLQVVGDFNVTNIWSKEIKLAGALLSYKRWFILNRTVRGESSVKDLKSVYSGTYSIPPNEMTWLRVSFHFIPKDGVPKHLAILKAKVAVIDQFGNHHWVENLTFKHPNAMLEP